MNIISDFKNVFTVPQIPGTSELFSKRLKSYTQTHGILWFAFLTSAPMFSFILPEMLHGEKNGIETLFSNPVILVLIVAGLGLLILSTQITGWFITPQRIQRQKSLNFSQLLSKSDRNTVEQFQAYLNELNSLSPTEQSYYKAFLLFGTAHILRYGLAEGGFLLCWVAFVIGKLNAFYIIPFLILFCVIHFYNRPRHDVIMEVGNQIKGI